ncbi:Dynamin GTPase [Penicillium sp. IBT 16267x]|nr:Dynamin GTPase [Penicillium sp. IBT 16267x]
MGDWTPNYVCPEDLENEVKNLARENRGLELPGSPNQLLVGILFRHQCEPWEDIAKSHIMNSWDSVKFFIQLVLRDITDDHTRPLLMRHLISPELEGIKESLLEKLDELTSYLKSGHPLPVGKSFLSKILESREKRQLAALKQNLGFQNSYFSKDVQEKTIDVNDLERAASGLQSSSDQFAVTEIVAQMQAYYDTAIVTFVDNVAILAIENCLLRPLENIFTGQAVLDLDDNKIRKIAAEPPTTQKDRERLTEELEKLRKGRQALNAFRADGSSLRAPPILGHAAPPTSTPVSQPKAGNARSKGRLQRFSNR